MRLLSLLLMLAAALASPARAGGPDGWTAAWASAQMVPVNDQVVPEEWLEDATLRQIARVGLDGPRLRLRLSNAHGTAPLAIGAVTVARSADHRTARIEGAALVVRFGGQAATVIPAGAEVWSDPVEFPVIAADDVVVSIRLPGPPSPPTGHPGSRATTYFAHGDQTVAGDLPGAQTAPRWLVLERSEERRVGKECSLPCRSRWSPYH